MFFISGYCPEPVEMNKGVRTVPDNTKLVPTSRTLVTNVTMEEEHPRVNVTESGHLYQNVQVS